jgi:multiple antibiotic resistance protein
MSADTILQTSLYFLALINPVSKIFILSSLQTSYPRELLLKISLKATIAAWLILLFLSSMGHFVLKIIFHVEIYSLQVAGGIVLFIIGLTAVRKGRFFEQELQGSPDDFSIVPLAAPMIAGPGTITAAISFSSTHGMSITILSLSIAILINFLLMLSSPWIGRTFERFHVFGPFIRITGLIVAAVAVQMVLTGLAQWLKPLL